jgi:tripartite-type tricarboxylate transporter receptor subunit TctC
MGLSLLFASATALAANERYPEKSIRFVAPYAPGGATDLLTRTMAQKLTELLGVAVVTDNRPGAGGNVGAEIVAKSPADGYTLLLAPVSPMAINVSLYGKKLPFNPERDFAPITLVAKVPLVLMTHLNVPAKTLKQFIDLAKARPGQMTYGSSGNGSSNHLTGAMLMTAAHIQMIHVPYKGGGPGMVALMGGEVDMMVAQIPSSKQMYLSGKVRALGVSGAKRSSAIPDVPTIMEAGVPGFEATSWYCVVVPAGTPAAIIRRLHTEFIKILNTAEVSQRLSDEGAEISTSSPEQLKQFIHTEIAKWSKAVKDSKASID